MKRREALLGGGRWEGYCGTEKTAGTRTAPKGFQERSAGKPFWEEGGGRVTAELNIGGSMEQTDEMLIDLMGGLDLALLMDDHLEADLDRGRASWLTTFIRERNWRKDAGEPVQSDCVGEEGMIRMTGTEKKGQAKKKKMKRMLPIEKLPLSYEWGEAIRTDMGKRFHNGMRNMKRRAAALWGFASGALTMAVIALSFLAIMGRKKPTA